MLRGVHGCVGHRGTQSVAQADHPLHRARLGTPLHQVRPLLPHEVFLQASTQGMDLAKINQKSACPSPCKVI